MSAANSCGALSYGWTRPKSRWPLPGCRWKSRTPGRARWESLDFEGRKRNVAGSEQRACQKASFEEISVAFCTFCGSFEERQKLMPEENYPKHYCGVFGIYNHPKAAELTYFGLYALQHRGQE